LPWCKERIKTHPILPEEVGSIGDRKRQIETEKKNRDRNRKERQR
jgi:hypothetical protein